MTARTMSPERRHRFRVGLAGLVALALVAGLIALASSLRVGAAEFSAELEHTGGLRPGEEVQVAGVGVGEVTAVELAGRDQQRVTVHFTVDDDVRLGDATSAEVKVATLLGTHYLEVTPAGAGRLTGDRIPLERTRVPFNLQDVIDASAPELEEFDTAAIERSMAVLADTLDSSREELGPALDGVRDLSQVAAARSADLGRLLRAARQVTGQLTESGGDLVTLMRQADLLLDTLRSRRTTIHALLRDLATFGEELAGVIEDTRADVTPMLRDLSTVIGVLRRHERSLDTAITSLAPAARYFANASGTGPFLNQYVPGGLPDNVTCRVEGHC